MRKPLLLIVDDDRAVLEALEAELAPEFAQLCRIESFDNPRHVLEALPRWASQRRAIAVAIVDQKMPGMTGVDLLAALRCSAAGAVTEAFSPPRFMQAIMLTGYAGLESAVAAKNEGGVGGYVEKPWAGAALKQRVLTALADYCREAGAGGHYLVHEPTNAGEMMSLLRVRRAVYEATPGLRDLLPPLSVAGMDASPFDPYSHHLLVSQAGPSGGTSVGCLRVATDHCCESALLFGDIAASHPELGAVWGAPRPAPLPLMLEFPEVGSVVMESAGDGVLEPGRLCLRSQGRDQATEGGTLRNLSTTLRHSHREFTEQRPCTTPRG